MAKKTATKKTIPTKPPVKPNEFTLVFTADEMLSAINILSFSKDIFNQMALNLKQDGDAKNSEILAARALVSQMIFARFRDAAEIGEPTAREIH